MLVKRKGKTFLEKVQEKIRVESAKKPSFFEVEAFAKRLEAEGLLISYFHTRVLKEETPNQVVTAFLRGLKDSKERRALLGRAAAARGVGEEEFDKALKTFNALKKKGLRLYLVKGKGFIFNKENLRKAIANGATLEEITIVKEKFLVPLNDLKPV